MNIRNFFHKLGSFCLSFGALLVASGKEEWHWWAGTGMVIAGPLMQMGNKSAPKILPPANPPPESNE